MMLARGVAVAVAFNRLALSVWFIKGMAAEPSGLKGPGFYGSGALSL